MTENARICWWVNLPIYPMHGEPYQNLGSRNCRMATPYGASANFSDKNLP